MAQSFKFGTNGGDPPLPLRTQQHSEDRADSNATLLCDLPTVGFIHQKQATGTANQDQGNGFGFAFVQPAVLPQNRCLG